MTDAVILVGGRGKRLGKLTLTTPKPLIKINKKRFLDILLNKLIFNNFDKIYLVCSYKKEKFFKLYHNRYIGNSKVICIDEGVQKGTGGALFKVKNKIKTNFFLLNGDTFFDIKFSSLSSILNKNLVGVIALSNNKSYKKNNKMNNLFIDKSNIIKFSKSSTNKMNGGIYYFNKKIFTYITNKKISLENDILKKLIDQRLIKGVYFGNRFIDIGTHKNLIFSKRNFSFFQ